MLIGVGKVRFLTVSNLVVGLVNITLGVLLLKVFNLGVMSFAYAYFIVFVIRNGIVMPIYLSRTFNIPLGQYFKKGYLGPICTAATMLPIAYGVYAIMRPGNWAGIVASAAIVTGCFLPITYLLGLDTYDRTMFGQMAGSACKAVASYCKQCSHKDSEAKQK